MKNLLFIMLIIGICLLRNGKCCICERHTNPSDNKSRSSRSIVFPPPSGLGIFVALALPLDMPYENVICSYNIEFNYNLPTSVEEIVPGPLDRLDLVDNDSRNLKYNLRENKYLNSSNATPRRKKKKKRHRRRHRRTVDYKDLITRKQFYKIVIHHLKGAGYKGRECLLRLICEVNMHSIEVFNGVTGSIIHIMFSPTTSEDEGLHEDFYIAEYYGVHENCSIYEDICEHSILDMFSKDFWISPK